MNFLIILLGVAALGLTLKSRVPGCRVGVKFAASACTVLAVIGALWNICHDPELDPAAYARDEHQAQLEGFRILAAEAMKVESRRPLRLVVLSPADGAPLAEAMMRDLTDAFGPGVVIRTHCSRDMGDPESWRRVALGFDCDLVLAFCFFSGADELESLFVGEDKLPRVALYQVPPMPALSPWIERGDVAAALVIRSDSAAGRYQLLSGQNSQP